MKTKAFVKACRQRNNIEKQINEMTTKEVIEVKADLKRAISGNGNIVSLLIFEVSFFVAFLSLMVNTMGQENGQVIAFPGAIVAFILFVAAIVGGIASVYRKSYREEALSYLEDYLQEKNKKANNIIMTEEYKQTCARYRSEVEYTIANWEQVLENAEKQMELYQSLLTGLLDEKEEGGDKNE